MLNVTLHHRGPHFKSNMRTYRGKDCTFSGETRGEDQFTVTTQTEWTYMFLKIWLSESMSKNGTFLKTLECTTAVLSSHRKAWPVRRAEGRHTWVPSYFKQTPMCLMICSTSAGCQVWTTDCTGVRSREHHPPCKSAWKTNPGFSRDLIKQTQLLRLNKSPVQKY